MAKSSRGTSRCALSRCGAIASWCGRLPRICSRPPPPAKCSQGFDVCRDFRCTKVVANHFRRATQDAASAIFADGRDRDWNMDYLAWAAILLAIGLSLAMLEVFVPSGGLLGFMSMTSMLAAIFLAFRHGPW